MDLSRPCFDRVLAFVADETVVSCSAVAVKKCTILSVGCRGLWLGWRLLSVVLLDIFEGILGPCQRRQSLQWSELEN